MPTYSINYKEELKRVENEMDVCEKVISGQLVPEGHVEVDAYKERLRHLKRYRGTIIDNPKLREGVMDTYIIR